jgi:hypothetical protein
MGWLGKALGGGLGLGLGPIGAVVGANKGSELEDKFNEGQAGVDAGNSLANNPGIQNLIKEAQMSNDPAIRAAIQNYATGQGSLQDVLASDSSGHLSRALATDPSTGSKMATDQVQNNPLLSSVFGKGGLNDRLDTEEQELASRGWTMKPEDYEAYGQASDETARLASQEEASLSQALASRGLAAAPSGAAQVGFTGIQGNKFERLASAQRKIADDRMKMNQERLTGVRNQMMQGNQLAQGAIKDQFGRNLQGVQQHQTTNRDAANAGAMQQGQQNIQFEQQQNTQGPSLGEILGTTAGTLAGGVLGGPKGAQMGMTLGSALGSTSGKRV